MLQTYDFAAAGRQIDAAGVFFRYESETSGAANQAVRVRVDGSDVGLFLPGDSFEAQTAFSRISIEPVTTAAGTVRVGMARVITSRTAMSGSIGATVTSQTPAQSTPTNTTKSASAASAQLLAANANRRYLLIQNKDPSFSLWLYFGAAAATQANGFKLAPGGVWEWDFNVPITEIRAISDGTMTNTILVLEG